MAVGNGDKYLFGLVVVAVAVAVMAAGFSYFTISDLSSKISGYATSEDNATVNITIQATAAINFTTDNIAWGSGTVDISKLEANLSTSGAGSVTDGNWTAVGQGLILENIGNINVSIELQSSQGTAAAFIGGTNPGYWWNITNSEAGSCNNVTGFNLGQLYEANSSLTVCGSSEGGLGYLDVADSITIDIKLRIPYDSLTGARSDIITAVGTSV